MDQKKQRELSFLNEFRTLIPDFPRGQVQPADPPDFLIVDAGRVVGIELVDYVRGDASGGSLVRKAESDREVVAEIARAAFEAEGHVELLVDFVWGDHGSLNKRTRQALGEAAARLVRQNIPTEAYQTVWLRWPEMEGTPLFGVVHSMSIMLVRKGGLWTCTDGGFVTATLDEFVGLIESKNVKAPSYRQSCQELWLLVVAEGAYISSNLDVTEELLNYEFESLFDRVFLYQRLERTVRALRVEPRNLAE